MNHPNFFSIGHGNRTIDDFIGLLKQYQIKYLIDVRSNPYSKFNPQFNRNDISFFLETHGIRYVFMGNNLGGKPADLTCYDGNGHVDYLELKNKVYYKEGIERLKSAYIQDLQVAIMCSESNPCKCHRSKLIGMTLLEDMDEKICLQHIDENGKIKDQALVMNEINKGRNPKDLFDDVSITTSRKSYLNKNPF